MFILILDLAKDDTLLFCFKIEFVGPNNGSYTLGANSQESMEQWMKSLKAASFNCVKSIIANLEKSLNCIEGIFIWYNNFQINIKINNTAFQSV